jgi:energy-coupling factor transporter ATP-binding protein EcfA2
LFAIFRYKPSPFCILDEVDAPLDEVNTERFVRLVRDMSRDHAVHRDHALAQPHDGRPRTCCTA